MAAENVHGIFLFSIDVSTMNPRELCDTDQFNQGGTYQHANSHPHCLRLDWRDLYHHSLFYSLWLSSNAQKLADLSKPWK